MVAEVSDVETAGSIDRYGSWEGELSLMAWTAIAIGPLVLNLADLCLVFGLPLLLAGVVIGEVRRVRDGDGKA